MATRRKVLALFATGMAAVVAGPALSGATGPTDGFNATWGYTGDIGPQRWAQLDPKYATCGGGAAQSPIDLDAPSLRSVDRIEFAYQPTPLTVINNGHTAQVNYAPGSGFTVDGSFHELAQFHFHHPSEHTLGGERFAMELHLVHQNPQGATAVVAMLIRSDALPNPVLAPVFDSVPPQPGETPTGLLLNIADVLPPAYTVYTYAGSLTTPPCTEGVQWFVMSEPITLAQQQIDRFTAVFGANARPTQPLNGRQLTEDVPAN